MRWTLCLLAVVPHCLSACGCLVKLSLCQEVAASSAVFIGKVESVYPYYLDLTNRRKAAEFQDEVSRLHGDSSPGAVQRLKAVYSNMLGEVPDRPRIAFESASSIQELDAAFDKVLAQGRQVRLNIRQNFLTATDDGQPDDDANSAAANQRTVVWTGVDDCGVDFQSGETYLIYANSDEQTGKLETSACSRTRRLTDAAADLGYLFFVGEGEGKSVRIEGRLVPPSQDPATDKLRSANPSRAGLVVSLSGGGQRRYTRSGQEGGFVFEGLAPGVYTISVYTADFPQVTVSLGEPVQVSASEKTCATPSIPLRTGWSAN